MLVHKCDIDIEIILENLKSILKIKKFQETKRSLMFYYLHDPFRIFNTCFSLLFYLNKCRGVPFIQMLISFLLKLLTCEYKILSPLRALRKFWKAGLGSLRYLQV